MPRAFILYVTIVAAFPATLAAAPPISDDVPVTAEVAAVARTLGLDPPHDRARFVSELARLMYTPAMGKTPALVLLLNPKLIDPELIAEEKPMRVPVPLSAEIWSRVIKRTVRSEQLITAIMTDRRAALICYALAALDDDTLAYLAQRPEILARIYERDAHLFAAFGASLRIQAARVVTPGGPAAVSLWETVLRESTANPEAFIRVLFSASQGHLAYIYDTIAELDAARQSFVLGSWMADPGARLLRFTMLLEASSRSYREWRLDTLPFSRPLYDISLLLARLRVEPSGRPSPPGSRAFWSGVFASEELRADAGTFTHDPLGDTPVDAAWLAETTSGDMFWRGDRIDQVAFGQRVFAGVPESQWADAVVAIRAFPKQRALLLTLERMGVTSPAVYATIARQASRVSAGSPHHAFWTLAQLESVVAIVSRMTIAGTITPAAGQRLITSVFALPIESERYEGALAAWFEREMLPMLPAAEDVESRVIAGIAGPGATASAPRVFWEGQQYRLDLAAGERRRLHAVRDKQEGYSVDLALALAAHARTLASDALSIESVRATAEAMAVLLAQYDGRLDFSPETRAPGVDEPRPAKEWLEKVIEDLTKAARNGDVKRAARLAATIRERVDDMLGDALLSLAYAADLGDPDGAAMLARNVALRHDFGFGRKDSDVRMRTVWSIPRQDFLPGVPWHVTGSVVGLDIAMATLSLRRVSPDQIAGAPRLGSNEREAFAISVSLMNARRLTDDDRDAIVDAIDRGRERVARLNSGGELFDAIAAAVGMDGWRRRAIRWMLAEDRAAIPSMFSLVEFLMLGGGATGANLDAWGGSALQLEACSCTRFATPHNWRLLSGRPQMAFMAAAMPDLQLFIAMKLKELKLPAALARTVLQAAVLDYVEEVSPTDPNDWWTLVRRARTVPQNLVEDYVASAAAVDGPLVPDETESTRQP